MKRQERGVIIGRQPPPSAGLRSPRTIREAFGPYAEMRVERPVRVGAGIALVVIGCVLLGAIVGLALR